MRRLKEIETDLTRAAEKMAQVNKVSRERRGSNAGTDTDQIIKSSGGLDKAPSPVIDSKR